MISIIVPTRPNIDNICNLIQSFNQQDFPKFSLLIVIDQQLSKEEFTTISTTFNTIVDKNKIALQIFSNSNSDFKPQKNASNTRNYGILHAKTEFSLLLDDDILADPDYLKKNIEYYQKYTKKLKKDLLLTGSLIYRKTGNIQNQGFSDYNYWFSRPYLNILKNKKWDRIRMYGGCGIFGKTKIFQAFLFDKKLDFIVEDIDFTYRITKQYPMIVDKNLRIYHMDREKNILEHAQIGSEFSAYRKGKHRITFVKKNANISQKIIFYGIGIHLSNLRLSVKILRWGKQKKWKILKSFRKGTRDGLRERI